MFSDVTSATMRAAHGRIMRARRGDDFGIFDAVRTAMVTITGADSFYIAIIRPDTLETAFPYTWDAGHLDIAHVYPYGEHGLTAWLLANRRTYRFSQDAGRLISRGTSFGDTDVQSLDAIVTPFLDQSAAGLVGVTGYAGVLSNTAHRFTDEHVLALEWLCRAVVAAWQADRTFGPDLDHVYPDLVERRLLGRDDIIEYVSSEAVALTRLLRASAARLAASRIGPDPDIGTALERCERLAEWTGTLLTERPYVRDPLSSLTTREREVADLLVADASLTNAAIAARLDMAEATTRTHVSRILRKLGLRQRSEIQWIGQVR